MPATQPTLSIIVGQSAQITATILDGYGRVIPYSAYTTPVTWSSSDATKATAFPVASNKGMVGVIGGVAVGTATITVTLGSATSTLSVSIVAAPTAPVPTTMVLDVSQS